MWAYGVCGVVCVWVSGVGIWCVCGVCGEWVWVSGVGMCCVCLVCVCCEWVWVWVWMGPLRFCAHRESREAGKWYLCTHAACARGEGGWPFGSMRLLRLPRLPTSSSVQASAPYDCYLHWGPNEGACAECMLTLIQTQSFPW